MHGTFEDIGKIVSAAIAADDAIDGSFAPGSDGGSYGIHVVHRGSLVEISQADSEGRYRVLVDFTPSVILTDGYNKRDISERADIDVEDAPDTHIQDAVASMLKVDLERAEAQVEELVPKMERELSPIDSRYTTQTLGDTDVWNGFLFYDYLYPREDDFTTTQYRQVVDTVYQEATVASQLARDTLDILQTGSSGGVGTDESVSDTPSPAFH